MRQPAFDRNAVTWRVRGSVLAMDERTRVMGVLNVTPDSFSDGGAYVAGSSALDRAKAMIDEGADIVDVGGESSRPGALPVSLEEELRRTIPVIEGIVSLGSDVLISIDTTKAEVARRALEAGAHIVNDISACTHDVGMTSVVASSGAGVIIMHMQGTPRTMQAAPAYQDVVQEVADYLDRRITVLEGQGVRRSSVCVDPGIGFGKTTEHNVRLLAGIDKLVALGCPVLVGLSRKSFLGKLTGLEVADRLAPSLAGIAYAMIKGAHVVRVHDVKESCAVARLMDMFKREGA